MNFLSFQITDNTETVITDVVNTINNNFKVQKIN